MQPGQSVATATLLIDKHIGGEALARIAVITHEYDQFVHRDESQTPWSSIYLLFPVLEAMERRGHSWHVGTGPHAVPGDIAILHIDATRIDESYLALAAQYPAAINFGTSDISKRRVSGALLTRDTTWTGAVIVKSDLNYFGLPEVEHNKRAVSAGQPPPYTNFSPVSEYIILPSAAEVTQALWDDPTKVVERFLREPDENSYALRSWVFMGNQERCSRRISPEPIVKANNSISRTAVPVPEALRAERKRLGFDYGKFDFVMYEGVPILLDANRTPARPPMTEDAVRSGAEQLADGMEEFIRQPVTTRLWRRLLRVNKK